MYNCVLFRKRLKNTEYTFADIMFCTCIYFDSSAINKRHEFINKSILCHRDYVLYHFVASKHGYN